MNQDMNHSQLFTLRLWWEDLGEGETEWRGQLLHVSSGQMRHFSDWSKLVPLVFSLLAQPPAPTLLHPPAVEATDALDP